MPRSKASCLAARHEGQRRGLRARHAAGDRRIERGEARLCRGGMELPCSVHLDGGAVDEERARLGARQDAAVAAIGFQHVLARRQHGDDDVLVGHGLRRARHDSDAGLGGGIARLVDEVEPADRVARFHQIGRHGQAHVSEPDEADRRHWAFLLLPASSSSSPRRAPAHPCRAARNRPPPFRRSPQQALPAASADCGPCRRRRRGCPRGTRGSRRNAARCGTPCRGNGRARGGHVRAAAPRASP